MYFGNQRAEFKELRPRRWTTKTGSNWAPTQISKHWKQFRVEPTMVEPRPNFKTRFNFSQIGLWWCKPLIYLRFKTLGYKCMYYKIRVCGNKTHFWKALPVIISSYRKWLQLCFLIIISLYLLHMWTFDNRKKILLN